MFAGVIAANLASIKVVDKLGFGFDSVVNAAGKEFNLYMLSREAWVQRREAV
jgi:RimJ/RimL family protein N-acetyltransferase